MLVLLNKNTNKIIKSELIESSDQGFLQLVRDDKLVESSVESSMEGTVDAVEGTVDAVEGTVDTVEGTVDTVEGFDFDFQFVYLIP